MTADLSVIGGWCFVGALVCIALIALLSFSAVRTSVSADHRERRLLDRLRRDGLLPHDDDLTDKHG